MTRRTSYVAIRAYDSEPDLIESRVTRRDDRQGDQVEIFLDRLLRSSNGLRLQRQQRGRSDGLRFVRGQRSSGRQLRRGLASRRRHRRGRVDGRDRHPPDAAAFCRDGGAGCLGRAGATHPSPQGGDVRVAAYPERRFGFRASVRRTSRAERDLRGPPNRASFLYGRESGAFRARSWQSVCDGGPTRHRRRTRWSSGGYERSNAHLHGESGFWTGGG